MRKLVIEIFPAKSESSPRKFELPGRRIKVVYFEMLRLDF